MLINHKKEIDLLISFQEPNDLLRGGFMVVNDCIFFHLAKANQAAGRYWGKRISSLNVTAVQGMVINFLFEEDAVTSSNLGERTQLDSATLTGVLDRLEGASIIERRSNPEDRRAILVCLTDKGRSVATKVRKAMENGNREFLKILSDEEATMLREFLRRLREAW